MTVSLISAMAANRVIGHEGKLPWHVPEDLRFFKRMTMGHAIIMGRKTWEPAKKPLPGRRNIIVTRDLQYKAENAEVFHSIEEAITHAKETDPDPFVIGGSEIYSLAMPLAQRMYITYIAKTAEGDAVFPPFECPPWREVERRSGETEGVEFVTYER